MQDILVVVDMQNDFIDGALGTKEAAVIVSAVERKIRNFQGRVFFTRDTHDAGYLETQEGRKLPVPHCIRDTEGWQIHPALEALRTEPAIDKPVFGSVALGEALCAADREEQVRSITFVGLCTDICVISNALLARSFLPEAEVVVDAACCAGVTPDSHRTALKAMQACQIRVEGEATA